MDITALVFNGVISREVLAPVAATRRTLPAAVKYVSVAPGICRGFEPFHVFKVDATVDRVESTDLLLVPGGLGSISMMANPSVIRWIAATASRSRYVMSVSTGSLLLAAAGLLNGENASGHWLAHHYLSAAGANPSEAAVTQIGSIVTTAGWAAAASVAESLPGRILYGPAA